MVHPLVVVTLLGIWSGLPLALTGATLQAFLTDRGADLTTVALFTAVSLPYSLKALWAPVFDQTPPPLLGRRRGWLVTVQLLLAVAICSLPHLPPGLALAVVALTIAALSASQDVVIDALRAEILPTSQYGLGAAWGVFGYRIGMLLSGAGALIGADQIGWEPTFLVLGLIMGGGTAITLLFREPDHQPATTESYLHRYIAPFREFLTRRGAVTLITFIVLYKLADVFAGALATRFFLDLGITKSEIGTISKGVGLLATIVGGLLGGALLTRLSLTTGLLWFGVAQLISNLGFVALALVGPDRSLFTAVIAIENVCGGLGTAAYTAFIMSLCRREFTATQFALLTSVATIGRTLLAPLSGPLVVELGWVNFFMVGAGLGVPALLLLPWVKKVTLPSANTALR